MKTKLLLLAVGLMAPAWAAFVPLSIPYDWIELKNGRRLDKVMIHSCDTVTGKVGMLVAGEATTVALSDLPDEVANRVRELAPPATPAEIEAAREQERAARELARERELEFERVAASRPVRPVEVERSETSVQNENRERARVAAAAHDLARHYFTYEADPHSSVGYVFDRNFILEEPEPIAGWTGQWRVRGKVGIQYLTTNQGAVSRGTKDFELRIEAPPRGGRPQLVDVTVR